MTRPVRVKVPKRKRERDTRPANFRWEELRVLRESDPAKFERELKKSPVLRIGLENYERAVKG